jgi:glycosyltransferase involved in cell wall biosynthesis
MVKEYFNLEDTQHVLLWTVIAVAAVSFLVQLYYHLFIFRRVGLKRRKKSAEHTKPVSVILCVKNECDNLSKILPLILEQNYPEYEVIVVNDSSSDDSDEVLQLASNQYQHLHVRNLIANRSVHGKSVVLGVGIKAANYDMVVITDVACRPSANWLKSLSAGFDANIVTGYARCNSVGKLVRTARFHESLFRLGYALNKRPYTASGENDGFRKELFFQKGFNPLLRKLEKVEQVFFNSIMNRKNTAVVLLPEAIVELDKTQTFFDWCLECSGDLFSKRLFRIGTRHVKLPEIVSRTLFYPSSAAAAILTADVMWMWASFVGMLVLHLTVRILVLHSAQKSLGEKQLLLSSILWDFYSVFVYLYSMLLTKHRKAIRRQ